MILISLQGSGDFLHPASREVLLFFQAYFVFTYTVGVDANVNSLSHYVKMCVLHTPNVCQRVKRGNFTRPHKHRSFYDLRSEVIERRDYARHRAPFVGSVGLINFPDLKSGSVKVTSRLGCSSGAYCYCTYSLFFYLSLYGGIWNTHCEKSPQR